MERSHNYRAVAEFEEQESVLVSWPPDVESIKDENIEDVMVQLIRYLEPNVTVIVQCYYPSIDHAKSVLKQANIDISKIRFVRYESDDLIVDPNENLYVETTYPRDYGADIIMDDKGNRAVIDFDNAYYCTAGATRYDREAIVMNNFDKWHANLEGINEVVFTRLVSEGGDREYNGAGVMMAIEETEVAKRNPTLRRDEVEKEFKSLFNLDKVIWIPQSSFDDEDHFSGPIPGPSGEWNAYRSSTANGHIDEICRFVNKDTIILAEVTEEEAKHSRLDRINKERLDAAYNVLKKATDGNGNKFNIIRIPVPEPIYFKVKQGDLLYDIWMETKGQLGDKLLDDSPFPSGEMTVLPALSYCNFLITNNVVIGQRFYRKGFSEKVKAKDEEALRILQKAFPNRKILQVDTIALNLLGGGIHCATRQIPKSKMKEGC